MGVKTTIIEKEVEIEEGGKGAGNASGELDWEWHALGSV